MAASTRPLLCLSICIMEASAHKSVIQSTFRAPRKGYIVIADPISRVTSMTARDGHCFKKNQSSWNICRILVHELSGLTIFPSRPVQIIPKEAFVVSWLTEALRYRR